MDWYLDRAELVGELRRELSGYLQRHALPGSEDEIADAELIVSEAVGNAVRHTGGPVRVSLAWSAEQPVLAVYDIGRGFDTGRLPGARGSEPGPAAEDALLDMADLADSGRGLFLIQALAPEVSASVRANAGMVVSATLPVRRRRTRSFDPPRRPTNVLPDLHEARPEGGFGKEAFLRALVVQLSQAVETNHGPEAAEAAVAQVGTDVGWQMEEEFRRAEGIVGRLTHEEIGRCLVRLKHAIDGGFTVLEATSERIVLENHTCPFGDAVLRAPALCRMTSSVFGGIAARNSGSDVAVLLEERIAVGDPGCRVVVSLRPTPEAEAPFAHHYRPPAATPTTATEEARRPAGTP